MRNHCLQPASGRPARMASGAPAAAMQWALGCAADPSPPTAGWGSTIRRAQAPNRRSRRMATSRRVRRDTRRAGRIGWASPEHAHAFQAAIACCAATGCVRGAKSERLVTIGANGRLDSPKKSIKINRVEIGTPLAVVLLDRGQQGVLLVCMPLELKDFSGIFDRFPAFYVPWGFVVCRWDGWLMPRIVSFPLRDKLARLFLLRSFRADQDGSVTAYTIAMLVMMIVSTGMAVDYMRHESYRAELQDAVDRGVLAAASLTQSVGAQTTVEDYMKTANWIDDSVDLDVQVDVGLSYRRVSAIAEYPVPTYFLKLIGYNTLMIRASGAAEQRLREVEISLVLDISTSMADDNKIGKLRTAAKEFVDTVLTDITRPYTTISLVPYAGHVNAGADLYPKYSIAPLFGSYNHSYSNCIDFDETEVDSITLDPNYLRQQLQFFVWGGYGYTAPPAGTAFGWCPSEASSILPFSNDNDALKTRIDGLTLHEATAIHYGMKWGVGLLDPSSESVLTQLINEGKVDSGFAGRPAAYTDPDALKFVILMTDGMITPQFRVRAQDYDSISDVDYWAANRTSANWWQASVTNQLSEGYGGSAVFKTSNAAYSAPGAQSADRAANAATLQTLCTGTKNEGVTVFTIAFGAGAEVGPMQSCATPGPGHFYQVDGVDIGKAFQNIANTILNLKLIY